ncbi:MAG TPA: hypothetical protein VFD59_02090 [Nocardioidaceae bacterium]|nr:hypothetical protein [Nocardioidaceae bacterium]
MQVARAAGRPWRSEAGWAGAWIGDRGALTNPVILVQPMSDPTVVLDEVDELFAPHVPYFLISPWPTPDLRSHGLELLGHPPLMVRFPAVRHVPTWPGVEVQEVRNADELAIAERILVEGYPMPDIEPLTAGGLLGPSILQASIRVWIGSVDGRPASVAAAHLHAGATLVEYVAALTTARGRGAGAAVTWAATLVDRRHPQSWSPATTGARSTRRWAIRPSSDGLSGSGRRAPRRW